MMPSILAPSSKGENMSFLKIENLSVALPRDGDRFYAIEGISLEVAANEVVCLVGNWGQESP